MGRGHAPGPAGVVPAGPGALGYWLFGQDDERVDVIWLAQAGWAVVGADISGVALERAAQHAADTDPAAAARIEWRKADLLAQPPEPDSFDLVSAQFIQMPPDRRVPLFAALAAAVRDGGMLLIVGHHPSDLETGVPRPPLPEVFYTPEEIAAPLDGSWAVRTCAARPRPATTPDGAEVTVHDTVLAAVRGSGPPAQT